MRIGSIYKEREREREREAGEVGIDIPTIPY
jgi:hypothetical protein